jgi:fatty acid desaturase
MAETHVVQIAPVRQSQPDTDIRALKARDNVTNFGYLARVYVIIAVAIFAAIEAHRAIAHSGLSLWWHVPVALMAILVIGASQHQFGGVVHEGTHHILFANRTLNELISDWFAAFPIYTSTYQFRVHHLAHHQFVNDAERDPDWTQLKESGHWLDFPITHLEFLTVLAKQLWLPNLFRYTVVRAKFSALGFDDNPYKDESRGGSKWPTRIGVLYAVGAPAASIGLLAAGHGAAALSAVGALWALVVTYYALLPEKDFPGTRLEPVISHRATSIGRVTFMGLVYAALTIVEAEGWGPAWNYYGLYWILPLFTTFPLFMVLRQWVQHGNADRGRYTNTRVFLVNPFIRYAVFPWGMDYHLPHHIMASVPHYKLKALHEALTARDPEYAEKGVVVEGYFYPPHDHHHGHPTVLEALGPDYAPQKREAAYVDNAAIEEVVVKDLSTIAREAARSAERD